MQPTSFRLDLDRPWAYQMIGWIAFPCGEGMIFYISSRRCGVRSMFFTRKEYPSTGCSPKALSIFSLLPEILVSVLDGFYHCEFRQHTANNLGDIVMSCGEFASTKPPTRFQSFFFMGILKKGPTNQVCNQIQKMFAWKSDHLMAKWRNTVECTVTISQSPNYPNPQTQTPPFLTLVPWFLRYMLYMYICMYI